MKALTKPNRSGGVLIAVLVCMAAAMVILLGLVRTSINQRRQLRTDLQLEQTKWMLDAGIRKGISKLKQSPDYDGETIELEPEVGRFKFATVMIEVLRDDDSNKANGIRVTSQIKGKNEVAPLTQRSRELVLRNAD